MLFDTLLLQPSSRSNIYTIAKQMLASQVQHLIVTVSLFQAHTFSVPCNLVEERKGNLKFFSEYVRF